ncbi:MAG TPA: gliding motility-associated protein GldE [Edaphocola sp.]|nr:gliding motility-associated protein GldE [Edaphocola sp.]
MAETIQLTLLADTPLNMLATNATAFLVLILTLLFIMAIAAGAEVAFFTLKAKDINYLKTKEHAGSRQAIRLLEQPDLLVATLRAAKYILSIAIIIVANFFVHFFVPERSNPLLSFLIILVSIMLCLLLFGEILPKVYARENNVRLVLFSAPVVVALQGMMRPFINLLVDSREYKVAKMARRQMVESDSREFEQAVELSLGHTATREEVDIFRGILKFGKITVKQIMHPRLDIHSVRESWTYDKVRDKMVASGYSRMPVYRNNIDEITGMIHTKDFLPFIELEDFDWHTLIRPVYFVHQHKLIEDLLREFQQKKNHFAVVVDEFGGTSGIITLEDIMEEIIGDIKDEFDEEELNYRKIDDHTFIFEGKMLINDICRIMGVSFDYFDNTRGESDSLAGLVLEIAGKFPTINECISFADFEFTVLAIEKLRISKVKVAQIRAEKE